MNYSGKINFLKIRGAFAARIQGKTAAKECICIPIEDAHLYKGGKGIYLNLNIRAIDPSKSVSGDSHIVSQNLPKEVYEALPDEQKKNQPILGSLREFQAKEMEITATAQPETTDDLPF